MSERVEAVIDRAAAPDEENANGRDEGEDELISHVPIRVLRVRSLMRDAIRGHQRHSEALRGHSEGTQRALRGHSEALRGTQRYSEALGGHSEALRGTQRALRGTHFGRAPHAIRHQRLIHSVAEGVQRLREHRARASPKKRAELGQCDCAVGS